MLTFNIILNQARLPLSLFTLLATKIREKLVDNFIQCGVITEKHSRVTRRFSIAKCFVKILSPALLSLLAVKLYLLAFIKLQVLILLRI